MDALAGVSVGGDLPVRGTLGVKLIVPFQIVLLRRPAARRHLVHPVLRLIVRHVARALRFGLICGRQ